VARTVTFKQESWVWTYEQGGNKVCGLPVDVEFVIDDPISEGPYYTLIAPGYGGEPFGVGPIRVEKRYVDAIVSRNVTLSGSKLAPDSTCVLVCPSIVAFSQEMEKRLVENNFKGGWKESSPTWLLARLIQEAGELSNAIVWNDPDASVREAADVANFAMMIAERMKALYAAGKGPR